MRATAKLVTWLHLRAAPAEACACGCRGVRLFQRVTAFCSTLCSTSKTPCAAEPYQLFMPPAVQQQSGEAAAQHEEARHPQALPRQSAGMPPPGTLLLEAGMCCEGDVPAQPAGGAPGAAAPAMPAALQECGDGRVCNPQPLAGTCLPAAISDAPAAALEATAANAAGTPVAAAAEVDAAGPAAQGEEEQQPAGTASGSTCLPSGEGSWGTMACGEQEAESLSVQQSAGDGLLQSLLQQPLQSPLQPPLQLPVQPSLQSPVQSPMQLPVQPPVQQDCGRATSGGGCGEPLQQRCYQATSGGGCGQPLEPAESGSTTCASSGSADLEAEGDGGVQVRACSGNVLVVMLPAACALHVKPQL